MSDSSRVCPSCRTPLPAEARFCLACGAPTPTAAWAFSTAALPPPDVAAQQLERLRLALEGRYAVEQVLGQGGMATVYVAEDVRHHRKVAVKVLRPELAAAMGPDRFLREIQVIAQLHHPHILMLIDSGEAGGALFYVMPFIEGESLRGRLERERELPIAEAVRIVRDVADALAHAHHKGIVHRDIKPDNILMSGRHALVADFGIAKAVSQATQHGKVTTAGVSLGTPAYMAPEQAMADPATDHRADIYALGVVAYELLTGEPPFWDAAPQNVLMAHVTQKPVPVSERRPAIPPALANIVMKCLEKHAADRWQSADELLVQLEGLVTPSLGMTPTSARLAARPGARPKWLKPAVGVGIVALAAASALVVRGTGGEPPAPATQRQLTFDGSVRAAEISPDGKLVMVRDVGGGAPVRVAAMQAISALRWTPDGASIFVGGRDAGGRWFYSIIPRLGGAARPAGCGPYVAFSAGGARVACWAQNQRARIRLLTVATRDTTSIGAADSVSFWYPGDWSPAGAVLAIKAADPTTSRFSLWTLDIAAKAWHRAVSDTVEVSSPRWAPDGGALYYLRAGELRKQRVRGDGTPRGEPVVLQTGVLGEEISLAATGGRLVYTRAIKRSNVVLTTERPPESGRFVTTWLTEGTAVRHDAVLSPDGAWIAYGEERNAATDLFVVPAAGGPARQLTASGRLIGGPAWAPSGMALAFTARVRGTPQVAIVATEGGSERVYARTQVGDGQITWAPGREVLYQRPGNHNFSRLDAETEAESALVRSPEAGWMFNPQVSPDGRLVALDWNRQPDAGVWVVALGDTTQRLVVARGGRGLIEPVGWTADGRGVYVRRFSPDDIALYPVTGGAPRRVLALPSPRAECSVREGPRGIRMACVQPEQESDVWLMEGFDGRRQ